MAHKNNEENLRSFKDIPEEEHKEISKKGGIASGEARRKKAELKKELEMILNSKNNKGKYFSELVSMGLIANAIDKNKGGNPQSFKILANMLGELEDTETETPTVNINIVDNTNLEKALYEDNN